MSLGAVKKKRAFPPAEFYAPEMCKRCGVCCGSTDGHPCEHLVQRPDGLYFCKIYADRFGPHRTVDGLPFVCVPIQTVIETTVAEIKRHHAGNAVVVGGTGDVEGLPGVLEVRRQNGDWHLSLEPGTDPQSVLLALARRGSMRIDHFEVAEPSLEDIFVTVVQGEAAREEVRHA